MDDADPSPSPTGPDPDPEGRVSEVVAAAFREEAGRALATVARMVGDLDLAEDAVGEAYAVALEKWPLTGVPDRPGAWITTVARNRALDVVRRESRRGQLERTAVLEELEQSPTVVHPVEDDQLQLLFTCCHPAFAPEVRVALALRFVCGLRVPEIARVLLDSEEAVSKRLQRAKGKIRTAAIPLRLPPADLLAERVPSVLGCVYLLFTEGYAATRGEALIRDALCDEAVRLSRLLARLLPDEAGAAGLAALVLLQDSRRRARLGDDGNPVLLADQDRATWDGERIDEGLRWLARAEAHPTMSAGAAAFVLQAALAAEHARAEVWEATDWPAIVALYDQLAAVTPSPVVLVNRAVAVSFADGPQVAIGLLRELANDPRLADSHVVALALAEQHERAGDRLVAIEHFELALSRAQTSPERALIRKRLRELGGPTDRAGAARP